ncbi:pyridoxal phosphate-dependent decarboxylase family protein [Trichothermofontia sp.]
MVHEDCQAIAHPLSNMDFPDPSFSPSHDLTYALECLWSQADGGDLPSQLPETGIGERATIERLAGHVLGRAAHLEAPTVLAHMDPPTPWITWAMALWNARLNQNLLHDITSPFATQAEAIVLDWLTPYFGMSGGHFCAGSTLANLTGLWAARDAAGVRTVVASEAAHLSIEKSCRLLGLELVKIPTDRQGRLDPQHLPPLQDACLVLTAGTTATGAIDPLPLGGRAKWTHVDAAWAGPLRLSPAYADRLAGIENADSVSVSAHKLLFQPKDSALILFRNLEAANAALRFDSGYLAKPNIGVQGSRSAAAIPLLATLLAWGRAGLASRLEHLMQVADTLADAIEADDRFEFWHRPQTGITVFRPIAMPTSAFVTKTPPGMLSTCVLAGEVWARSVAANPCVDCDQVIAAIRAAVNGDR